MRFIEIVDEQGRFCKLIEIKGETGPMERIKIQSAALELGFYKPKDYCLRKEFGGCEKECLGFDKKCDDYMSEQEYDCLGKI